MKYSRLFAIGKGICVFPVLFIYWAIAYWYAGDTLVGDILISSKDEIGYESKSANILSASDGSLDIFSPSNIIYAQSIQFGYSMFLAFFRRMFSDSFFLWLMVNNAVYVLGSYFFAKFIAEYTKTKSFVVIFFALSCYIPLALHSFSLMRDGLIFSFTSCALYLYTRRSFGWLAVMLLVLAIFRLHMALAVIVFIFFDTFYASIRDSRKGLIQLLLMLDLVAVILNFISGGFLIRKVMDLVSGVSAAAIFFDFFRFWIAPLPWAVSEELPVVVGYWFWAVFPFIALLFIYLVVEVLRGRLFVVIPLPLFAMFFFYFLVYSLEGTLGFRQVAAVAPFVFVPLMIGFVRTIGRLLSVRAA